VVSIINESVGSVIIRGYKKISTSRTKILFACRMIRPKKPTRPRPDSEKVVLVPSSNPRYTFDVYYNGMFRGSIGDKLPSTTSTANN